MNQLRITRESEWYRLFSRGARDWLRHNQKVREAVQASLPELVKQSDIISNAGMHSVRVPLQLMEHARFRLAEEPADRRCEIGQGAGKAGDLLHPLPGGGEREDARGGGAAGEVRLLMELDVDDIMDWLWDELQLPDLAPRPNAGLRERDFVREGWDRRGVRARLDRRRTIKEAVKRRAIQPHAPMFVNEDLRFRQLVQRPQPTTRAVVIFALDVSASMTDAERRLAKTFFFFVLQGIRRTYSEVEIRFIAHTTEAWEFSESDFFRVSGTGGTGASTAFRLALKMLREEYDPARYNAYLFYASDGENFTEDRGAAGNALASLAGLLNYIGYAETVPGSARTAETEMRMIFSEQERLGAPAATSILMSSDDVFKAMRRFFVHEAQAAEAP